MVPIFVRRGRASMDARLLVEDGVSTAAARGHLSTLIAFLARSDEPGGEADWLVVPVSADRGVVEGCARIRRRCIGKPPRVLLVKRWPRPDVTPPTEGATEARRADLLERQLRE